MNCEQAMKRLLEKDAHEGMGLSLRLHLLRCPSCAREARKLASAVTVLRLRLPATPDFSDLIMASLRGEQEITPVTSESLSKWITVGALVLAATVFSPFCADLHWLTGLLGSWILVPLFITLGAVLCIYAAFFIASHLEALSKRFGLNQR